MCVAKGAMKFKMVVLDDDAHKKKKLKKKEGKKIHNVHFSQIVCRASPVTRCMFEKVDVRSHVQSRFFLV